MMIYEQVEKWLWTVAVKRGVKALVGFLVSKGIVTTLVNFGIVVDAPKLELELTAFLIVSFEVVHDWLKLKTGWKWL